MIYDETFKEFELKIRTMSIPNITNVLKNPGYNLFCDYCYSDDYLHQKILDTNIFHTENSEYTKIVFPKKDVYHVTFYIFLILGSHFDCRYCVIEINGKKVNPEQPVLNDESFLHYMDVFIAYCSDLGNLNEVLLTFRPKEECPRQPRCKSCLTFRKHYPYSITPYKTDTHYGDKEWAAALKEGRRTGKF